MSSTEITGLLIAIDFCFLRLRSLQVHDQSSRNGGWLAALGFVVRLQPPLSDCTTCDDSGATGIVLQPLRLRDEIKKRGLTEYWINLRSPNRSTDRDSMDPGFLYLNGYPRVPDLPAAISRSRIACESCVGVSPAAGMGSAKAGNSMEPFGLAR